MSGGAGDVAIEMDLLPPQWLDVKDQVTGYLSQVAAQMRRLEHLHAQHVLPGFDNEAVKAREAHEIEALTHDITVTFGACKRAIQTVDRLVAWRGDALTTSDETIAQNLRVSLAADVAQASSTFRKKQAVYLKKLRGLDGSSSPLDRTNTALPPTPYTDPAMMDEENDRISAQSTLQQTAARVRVGRHDTAIAQREQEIERIARGVIDLSDIFQELNGMVIDQGSLLDRIDYNVERTSEHVQHAEKELTTATRYQKKSTRRKIILLLILLVVALFVALLFKPRRRSGRAPVSSSRERDQRYDGPFYLRVRRDSSPASSTSSIWSNHRK